MIKEGLFMNSGIRYFKGLTFSIVIFLIGLVVFTSSAIFSYHQEPPVVKQDTLTPILYEAYNIVKEGVIQIFEEVYNIMVDAKALNQVPEEYQTFTYNLAEYYGVPIHIVCNLVQAESSWVATARGGSNSNKTYDIGLSQLNSQYMSYFEEEFLDREVLVYLTQTSYREFNPYDPHMNLQVGVSYLAKLIRDTGSIEGGLWAYNAGIGRFRQGYLPESTKLYISKITTK